MGEETVKNETRNMKQLRMCPWGLGRYPAGLHFPCDSSLFFQWLNKILCSLLWQKQGEALPVGLGVVVVTFCLGGHGNSISVPELDQREMWSMRSRRDERSGSETENGYFAAGMWTAKGSQEQASKKERGFPKGMDGRVEAAAGGWAESQPEDCSLCCPGQQ